MRQKGCQGGFLPRSLGVSLGPRRLHRGSLQHSPHPYRLTPRQPANISAQGFGLDASRVGTQPLTTKLCPPSNMRTKKFKLFFVAVVG